MTNKNVYYTVSVLPEFDLDNWYVSPLAAQAVAWDSWCEGCSIAIHRHEVTPKLHHMELEATINPDGTWG